MASGPYSFIDIAVLEAVRGRFAAGDALAILTLDLETVIWANGAGSSLLGHSDIESAMGAASGLALPARRQISATQGFPRALHERPVAVRLSTGLSSRLATFAISSITLPDGEPAVMLAEPAPSRASLTSVEVAGRMIEGIGEAGYFAAIVDADAKVLVSSSGFDRLGIEPATLATLVSEVARQDDRLVKRLVPGATGRLPAGMARLADEPATHLLIAIQDVNEEDERAGEPADTTLPDLAVASERADPGEDLPHYAAPLASEPFEHDGDGSGEAMEESPLASDADLAERLEEDADLAGRRHPAARDLGAPEEIVRKDVEVPAGSMAKPADETRAVRPSGGDSDDWYFSRQNEPEPGVHGPDRSARPVRFVWRTDAAGAFSMISPEFAGAVGKKAADVVGRPFAEIARRFGLDPDGEIGRLLDRRDTWSGRTVLWPIEGTDLVVPVDLAALPNYGRDRTFEGFRGFGVVRMGDAIIDPAGLGLTLDRIGVAGSGDANALEADPATLSEEPPQTVSGEAAASETAGPKARSGRTEDAGAHDPFQGEVPVISIADRRERRESDKIIRLAEHRPAPAAGQLSPGERNAFEEIRERLRRDYEAARVEAASSSETPAAGLHDDGTGLAAQRAEEDVVQASADADASDDGDLVGDDHHDLADLHTLDGIQEDSVLQDESVGAPETIDELSARQEAGSENAAPDTQAPPLVTEEDGACDNGAEVAAYSEAAAEALEGAAILDGDSFEAAEHEEEAVERVADVDGPVASEGIAAKIATPGDQTAEGSAGSEHVSGRVDDRQGIAPASPPEERATSTDTFRPSRVAPAFETSDHLPSAFADDTRRLGVDEDLIAGLPLPILIHAGDDLYFANREFLMLTGYSSLDQVRREGGLDRLFSDDGPQMVAGEDGRKLRLRTLGGEEFPVDAHLQSVRWKSGTALLLSLKRVIAQPAPPTAVVVPEAAGDEEMARRVDEMRAIVDTATDGVVLIARDGTIRSISRPAEALFGFDSAEVEGRPFHTLFAIESQRAARDYLNGLADNGVASVLNDGREVIGREAEGRFIPLFMTMGRLPQDGGYCAVVRDITQWKRAEEDLTQARAQAERASSQKTEFLARVSHEIRTPLNAIIGFSELMIDEKFGPIHNDRYRDYLRDINRSGNHVLDLVNDLLDISKIEAGEQEMNYEAVSLNDTLGECVAMMQPQANRDRVIIRSSLASRLPEVVADLRSVRQIALNLLSNAIRYTQAGGQVIVSTSYEPAGDIVMRVRDTGIGMTISEIDQALKPFKQINALKRGRHDGTGLGLPLTKAMVEANRARFSISSTPGEGTMVEITFPSTRVLAN